MKILALDLATKTGWALGDSGAQPTSGVIRVRQPNEELKYAPWNLETFLQHKTTFDMVDLVVYEAPLSLHAVMRDGRVRNEESLLMPIKLEQGVERFCFPLDLRHEKVMPATVRRHFIGSGHRGKSIDTKRAVLAQCQRLGYVPKTITPPADGNPLYDQCDALALWDYAAAMWGKRQPEVLHMFGERA